MNKIIGKTPEGIVQIEDGIFGIILYGKEYLGLIPLPQNAALLSGLKPSIIINENFSVPVHECISPFQCDYCESRGWK